MTSRESIRQLLSAGCINPSQLEIDSDELRHTGRGQLLVLVLETGNLVLVSSARSAMVVVMDHQRNPQGVITSHYMHYIAITC